MKKEYKVAFFAVLFLSSFGRSDVMARKTGIVPSGLIKVKKEVKHKKRKEKAVSIVFFITNKCNKGIFINNKVKFQFYKLVFCDIVVVYSV